MNALDSLLDFAFQLDSASETLGSSINNNDNDNGNDNGNGQHIPGARCNEGTWGFDTAVAQLGIHHLTHLNDNHQPANTVYQSTIVPLLVPQQQYVPAYAMYATNPRNEPKHTYDMPLDTPNYYTEINHPVDEHIPQHHPVSNYDTSYNPPLLQSCHCVSNVPPWDRCYGDEVVKQPEVARPLDFCEAPLYTTEDSRHHDILGMFHGQETGDEQIQFSDGVYGFDECTSTREQVAVDAEETMRYRA